ncbi:hypothetical protein KC614_00885 [candidate division WWE3 bacterium]|uniref:Pre-16S rRNA nuclease n=1 Tax=candidate division WWE3 bacterium TaxID=2053526 RepID=A0A955LJG3_UNCKA|nr:hypothetical protein [candidate division WWE3 bacterium]
MDLASKSNVTILSLDLGEKHIGLACFKPGRGVFPLKQVEFSDVYKLEEELTTLISEYDVEVLLVGDLGLPKLPKDYAMLVDRLQSKTHVKPVVFSEYLSTFQSLKDINEREGVVLSDHVQAAVEIINDYLSS